MDKMTTDRDEEVRVWSYREGPLGKQRQKGKHLGMLEYGHESAGRTVWLKHTMLMWEKWRNEA